MFEQFLFAIDLFGVPIALNFFGKEKSKSKLGGICSILFCVFVAWAFINGSKELYQKTNPKTINSQAYDDDPSPIIIAPDDFPVAFQLQTGDDLNFQTYIDDSIYQLNVLHSTLRRIRHDNGTVEETWTDIKLLTERCTPEHFGKEIGPSYSLIFAAPITCIAPKQPAMEKVEIKGVFDSVVYERLLVELLPCNNKTSPVPCAPEEKINAYLGGASFSVLYNNVVVDSNDYTQPYDLFQDYYYTVVGLSNYCETYINIGHVEVSTDSGWLYESVEKQNFAKAGQIIESLIAMHHPRGVLVAVNIQVSKLISYYSRSYKKIQNILAEVSGLTNTSLFIFLVVITPYLRFKFRESLLNELFDANILQEKITQKSQVYLRKVLNLNTSPNEKSPVQKSKNGQSRIKKNLPSACHPLNFSDPLFKDSPAVDFEDIQQKAQSNSFVVDNDKHLNKKRKETPSRRPKPNLNEKYLSKKNQKIKLYDFTGSPFITQTQENLLTSNSLKPSPRNGKEETSPQIFREKRIQPNAEVLEVFEDESPERVVSQNSLNDQKGLDYELPPISLPKLCEDESHERNSLDSSNSVNDQRRVDFESPEISQPTRLKENIDSKHAKI